MKADVATFFFALTDEEKKGAIKLQLEWIMCAFITVRDMKWIILKETSQLFSNREKSHWKGESDCLDEKLHYRLMRFPTGIRTWLNNPGLPSLRRFRLFSVICEPVAVCNWIFCCHGFCRQTMKRKWRVSTLRRPRWLSSSSPHLQA